MEEEPIGAVAAAYLVNRKRREVRRRREIDKTSRGGIPLKLRPNNTSTGRKKKAAPPPLPPPPAAPGIVPTRAVAYPPTLNLLPPPPPPPPPTPAQDPEPIDPLVLEPLESKFTVTGKDVFNQEGTSDLYQDNPYPPLRVLTKLGKCPYQDESKVVTLYNADERFNSDWVTDMKTSNMVDGDLLVYVRPNVHDTRYDLNDIVVLVNKKKTHRITTIVKDTGSDIDTSRHGARKTSHLVLAVCQTDNTTL